MVIVVIGVWELFKVNKKDEYMWVKEMNVIEVI